MIIENTEALRNWLTNYLEPLCDADPQALAKYVMALIKKDKPEKDLKTVCLDQLEVFLQNVTITFVDTLFETLANKSYLKFTPTPTPIAAPSAPTTTTTTPKTLVQTSTATSGASGQLEAPSPVVSKSPELGNSSNSNKNTDSQQTQSQTQTQTNSQTNPKVESSHESSKLRDNKRNRSRSRSPFRNQRRNDFDGRRLNPILNRNNGSTHFGDDRRNRRGLMNNRRAGNQRFGGYRNERDGYRRRPDQKRGRSRSRSRSYSSESMSRSRSRSRSYSRDRESPANKRSRPSSRPTSRSPTPSKAVPKEAEKNKKCRDYEEKGFCLKGHLCPYDHGNDPVVLDSNVSAALGFTNNTPTAAPLIPIPNAGIPPNAPNSYLAEPYNPEAPGMDSQRPHPSQGPAPPLPLGPRMPPPHHYWPPMHIRGPMPNGPPLPPPQFMPPPGRPRELIGVPTIDNNMRHNQSISNNRTVIEPNIPIGLRGGLRGGINKNYGRGGYRNVRRIANESPDKSCLEVRKIPSNMNSISHLNQHFSKFGTIVNLQVCHEGDPEAALVQYATHGEALAAIRSTEAVLNNRFIKVFWHSKEQQQTHEQIHGVKTEPTDGTDTTGTGTAKLSIKDRLGPKVSETESVVTAVNSLGSISRTVFDPSKLKKNNTNNQKETNSANDTNRSIPEVTNTSFALKTKSANKEKTNKTQKEINSKQYKLLEDLITNQKQLMKKLEKSTNESEKKVIKETIDGIVNKIQLVYDSIKKQISVKKSPKKKLTREELKEELLNTDLDMFIKMQNKDYSYVELANKYAKLKKKEKSFALRGRGGKPFARRARGANRRGGGYYSSGANPLLKVDRRTRKLLIPDIGEDDVTDLLEHLAQFSDVEVIEPSSSGALVTFKTRVDAEKAIQNMSSIKFKENFQLNYSWFDDKISKSDKNCLTKTTEPKIGTDLNERGIEALADDLLDYEEDDTEDESEARNWKA